jgi:hypothetical protein
MEQEPKKRRPLTPEDSSLLNRTGDISDEEYRLIVQFHEIINTSIALC